MQDVTNTDVYQLSDDLPLQIFPVGVQNLPLLPNQLQDLQKQHCKKILSFSFTRKIQIFMGE